MNDIAGNKLKVGQQVILSSSFRKKYGIYAEIAKVTQVKENRQGLVTVELPNGDDIDVYWKSLTIKAS